MKTVLSRKRIRAFLEEVSSSACASPSVSRQRPDLDGASRA